MARSSKIQARVDQGTKGALDEYVDQHEFTQSEVVRSVLRQHLAREGLEVPAADGGIPERELEQKLAALEEQLAEDDGTDTFVEFLLNLASVTAGGAIVLAVASLVGLASTSAAISGGVVLLLVAVVALVGAAAKQL